MARLAITGDLSELHIELSTWDRLLAMHRKVHANLLHVHDARPWGGEFPLETTGRFHGTYVPGRLIVGSETLPDGRERFYDVRDPEKAIVIELHHDAYERVIVDVDDLPAAIAADAIRAFARKARSKAGLARPS